MAFFPTHTHTHIYIYIYIYIYTIGDFVVKNPPGNAGNVGSNPGSGRSPGEGNGNPLQYSCLENPKDRGVWWAILQGCKESEMAE